MRAGLRLPSGHFIIFLSFLSFAGHFFLSLGGVSPLSDHPRRGAETQGLKRPTRSWRRTHKKKTVGRLLLIDRFAHLVFPATRGRRARRFPQHTRRLAPGHLPRSRGAAFHAGTVRPSASTASRNRQPGLDANVSSLHVRPSSWRARPAAVRRWRCWQSPAAGSGPQNGTCTGTLLGDGRVRQTIRRSSVSCRGPFTSINRVTGHLLATATTLVRANRHLKKVKGDIETGKIRTNAGSCSPSTALVPGPSFFGGILPSAKPSIRSYR